MRYLLDTNICIYLMQHHPPEVAARFAELGYGDVVISSITLAELRYGVECRPENRAAIERALEGLLADVPVMPFDEQAAVDYGILGAAIRDRQRDARDRLIAAHARSLSLTLVTNNEVDFKDYPGLRVENWVAPA